MNKWNDTILHNYLDLHKIFRDPTTATPPPRTLI